MAEFKRIFIRVIKQFLKATDFPWNILHTLLQLQVVSMKSKYHRAMQIPLLICQQPAYFHLVFIWLTGNGWYDVWHVMLVLLDTPKDSGLDIFYAYSAIWIVAFHIQICCDRLENMQRLQACLWMLIKDFSPFLIKITDKYGQIHTKAFSTYCSSVANVH